MITFSWISLGKFGEIIQFELPLFRFLPFCQKVFGAIKPLCAEVVKHINQMSKVLHLPPTPLKKQNTFLFAY